ncbi:MAG: PIN-like domain-containing protein [Candidatus Binataceae bacterium]
MYLQRVGALITHPRTHIYFDTSFLMFLAKLGTPARDQFMDWQRAVGQHRFHVPLWAAHEFFKHRLKSTVPNELSSEIKLFDKAATRFYEKFRVYCSDDLFGFQNGGALFLDEYRRTVQPLRALMLLANNSKQIETGVQQISTYIDQQLLTGPLSEIINDVDADERIRNRGVIPPSFNDANKRGSHKSEAQNDEAVRSGDNSFGDLAFWREVLRHASKVRARSVIVATGDRKNDWYENQHGDKGLTEEIRRLVQNPRPVPTPHPLLVRETFDRNAGTLDLIDPMYCGVLLQKTGNTYLDFASAALDNQLPNLTGKQKAAARSWAGRFGQAVRIIGSPAASANTDGAHEQDVPDVEEIIVTGLDVDFLMTSTKVSREAELFIQAFNLGDVVRRAQLLTSINWTALASWPVTDLVALGRTVVRAAEGGDPSAVGFVSDLRDQAPELPPQVREPLYFGCLGALYFDDSLNRRAPSGAPVVLAILDLVNLPEVSHAAEALGEALKAQPPLFFPGSPCSTLQVEVVTKPSADNKSPADLLAIRLGDRDLTTTLQTEDSLLFRTILKRQPPIRDFKLGALIDVLARYHLLPRQLVKLNLDSDFEVRVAEFAGVELDA